MASLTELLAGIPVNAVLRERLALIKDQAESLEQEVVNLKKQLAEKNRQLSEAQRKLSERAAEQEFVKASGVLWAILPSRDGYEEFPHCPVCRLPMSALEGFFHFECSRCQFLSPFKGDDLKAVMAKLPKLN